MYLTRFQINPARRGARKLLGSPQAMHAAVLSGFSHPATAEAGPGRVLWRVDANGPDRLLYVHSPTRPDLTHLVEQAGWPTTQTWDTRTTDGLLESLTTGQRWNFRLRANPTKSMRPGDATRSQRYGHVSAPHQANWFLERAARHGFALPDLPPQPLLAPAEAKASATHEGSDKGTASPGPQRPDGTALVIARERLEFRRQACVVTLVAVTYAGTLEVTDPERLRTVLREGIGPAKAYGCGLMTLAPMNTR